MKYLIFTCLLSSCLVLDVDTNVNTTVNINVEADVDVNADVVVVIPLDGGWEVLTKNLPDLLSRIYEDRTPPQVTILLDGGMP